MVNNTEYHKVLSNLPHQIHFDFHRTFLSPHTKEVPTQTSSRHLLPHPHRILRSHLQTPIILSRFLTKTRANPMGFRVLFSTFLHRHHLEPLPQALVGSPMRQKLQHNRCSTGAAPLAHPTPNPSHKVIYLILHQPRQNVISNRYSLLDNLLNPSNPKISNSAKAVRSCLGPNPHSIKRHLRLSPKPNRLQPLPLKFQARRNSKMLET